MNNDFQKICRRAPGHEWVGTRRGMPSLPIVTFLQAYWRNVSSMLHRWMCSPVWWWTASSFSEPRWTPMQPMWFRPSCCIWTHRSQARTCPYISIRLVAQCMTDLESMIPCSISAVTYQPSVPEWPPLWPPYCWWPAPRANVSHWNIRVLIHQPMGGVAAGTQASDMEITTREIVKLKKELYTIIADHSGQYLWQDICRFRPDYWMTADEAKEYGMIDEVLVRSKRWINRPRWISVLHSDNLNMAKRRR